MSNDEEYTVSSELYEEEEFSINNESSTEADEVISNFLYEDIPESPKNDEDGDLIVKRRTKSPNCLKIGLKKKTQLDLVGLQVWRGALLLADWLIANQKILPKDGCVLELASGVGLTSIVASMFRPVVCTDINLGNILSQIDANIKLNAAIVKHPVKVLELDFTKDFSEEILQVLPSVSLVIAADVVYDDRITDALVQTLQKLLTLLKKSCKIYIALEKRFVFTLAECDTCAPCYDYFVESLSKLPSNVHSSLIPLDFPQYFHYDRVKELVLWQIHQD